MNMQKTVVLNIDTNIARKMLGVAGYDYQELLLKSNDEIFDEVLSMIDCYGAKYEVRRD